MAASPGPEPLLIGDVFRRNARVVPDQAAAALRDRVLTHRELDRRGNQLAQVLRDAGIGHGDRIVTWADTCLEVLPLFVAAAKLGAAFAPLNARLNPEEALQVVQLARPALLVSDALHVGDAERIGREAGVEGFGQLEGELSPGHLDLVPDRQHGSDEDVVESALRETDPHVIFFTSGSTGRPKGVVLSHRANYLRSFQGVFRDVPEKTVCMFPLFHMAAFTLALSSWQTRGEITFVATATADEILQAIERRRANRFYGIPLVWSRILEVPDDRYDLSSLRELDTGTQAVPIELVQALKKRFPGTATRIYYGSTEVGSGTTLPDADVLRKPGSVGPPSPGVDLKLADDGEICLRSAYLMDGYFEDPHATAEALRDGWFHSGDLGALDAEGHLQVIGRKKDVIRSGGESVAPTEVELALAEHEEVAEVAVVGVPDADWGEVVCAVVVPAEGTAPDLASIQAHCAERLAGFKKPRRLARVDSIPRTEATRQIQRPLLVERIQSGALPTERER